MSDLQCAARVFVARHGEAEYESHDLVDQGGWLTARGREQARAMAEQLAGERIAHVYSSPYSRAVQTAELAAAALGTSVTVRESLIEISVGDFVGLPSEPDPIRPICGAWFAGDLDQRIPGAESGSEVVARMRGVLDDIADLHRGEAVLVISHGAAMCVSLPVLATNLRADHAAETPLPNCGVIAMEGDSDGWTCRSWAGDSAAVSGQRCQGRVVPVRQKTTAD